jgi:methylmalonyl-CoA mutase N-terminal domain/subunit
MATEEKVERAVEDDLHRYVAPVVGPDDERVITDSGIEIKRLYGEDDVAPDLAERLGEPGAYPFTRGIHDGMYRDRLWTMRQYAGFSSPEDTNGRYRYLLEHGSTGLSMAFDLPTQLGRDSDDPLCDGDRHDRGRADLLRRDPAGSGLDLDDDQRAGGDPAVAL